jgi:hypothetical protein
MDASTTKSLPRYFPMDFALAGDSTITSDLLIASLHFRLLSVPAADLPGVPYRQRMCTGWAIC